MRGESSAGRAAPSTGKQGTVGNRCSPRFSDPSLIGTVPMMHIAISIVAIWFALNIAVVALLLNRRPHISPDDQRWLKLHPGMPLDRRPSR